MNSDVGEAIFRFAESARPSVSDCHPELRKQPTDLFHQRTGCWRNQSVPTLGIQEVFLFTTDDDTPLRGGAQIEVRRAAFPFEPPLVPAGNFRQRLADVRISAFQSSGPGLQEFFGLEPRRHHRAARGYHAAVLCGGANATTRFLQANQLRAVMDFEARVFSRRQEAMSKAVWIDLAAGLGIKRGRAREWKAVWNRRRIEKFRAKSNSEAERKIFAEFRYFALMTDQEQTGFALEAALGLQAVGQSLQLPNRPATKLVAARGGGRADLFDQFPERDIYFVSKQDGARTGAAGADLPLVNHQRLHSSLRQMKGGQRSRNPAANYNGAAGRIVFQRWVSDRETVVDRLKRMTRSEIHRGEIR